MSTKINATLMSNYDICPSIVWGAAPIEEILNNYFYATLPGTDTSDLQYGKARLYYLDRNTYTFTHIVP